MSTITINGGKPARATISAVIIRADGTRQDLGAIAFHHRNPLINAAGNLFIYFKRKFFEKW